MLTPIAVGFMVDISRTSYELVGLATNITGGHQPVTLHTPGLKLACRSPTRGVVDGEDPFPNHSLIMKLLVGG